MICIKFHKNLKKPKMQSAGLSDWAGVLKIWTPGVRTYYSVKQVLRWAGECTKIRI